MLKIVKPKTVITAVVKYWGVLVGIPHGNILGDASPSSAARVDARSPSRRYSNSGLETSLPALSAVGFSMTGGQRDRHTDRRRRRLLEPAAASNK